MRFWLPLSKLQILLIATKSASSGRAHQSADLGGLLSLQVLCSSMGCQGGKSFHCAAVICWGLVDQNPAPTTSSTATFNERILPWKALTSGLAGCFLQAGRESLLLPCWISPECRGWFQHPVAPAPHGIAYSSGNSFALSRSPLPRAASFFCKQKLLSCGEAPGWKVGPFRGPGWDCCLNRGWVVC